MTLRSKFCLATALLLSTAHVVADNARKTNYSGYLVDLYCFGLNRAGQDALDGTNVIKDPSQHTLHCLRDPFQCRNGGYYLAINSGSAQDPNYQIKFRLDEASNRAAVQVLDAATRPDRQPGRFTVTAVGEHSGDGILRNAVIVECNHQSCDGVCDGKCETPEQNFELEPSALLIAHVVFMILSWGCLLPLGVLWARNLRQSSRKFGGSPIWFAGHRILQSVGWLFQLIGFACIIAHKHNGGGKLAVHFSAPHEVVGLIVVILGSVQPINAQLRRLPCVGHFKDDGHSRTTARIAWEWLHKGQGYVAVILGAINVVVGVFYANSFGFSAGLVVGAALSAGTSLSILLIACIFFEVQTFAISIQVGKRLDVDPSVADNATIGCEA